MVTEGVFEVTKTGSQAWTVGAAIYGVGTTTLVATTATTSGNILIGTAVAAVGSGAGETIGRVRLNGSAPAAVV
jgi:predicted RecA/RadA family phage recombinase